jgi:ubiquinone/menaquinone biosynthesis C-methylase UbiE
MEQSYASRYHKLEENHWWFKGRRDIIFRLIKDYHRDIEILDTGCSGCALIGFLMPRGFKRLQGVDIDENAIEICRQKRINNVRVASAEKTGFKDQQFDVIIASDILEHIKNEDKALSEWYRILKPNGNLLIFVPAFKFLWSKHDEINHHYRRYSKSDLIRVLKENGFSIERSSYWNFSLFFPVSLARISQKFFLNSSRKSGDQLCEVNPFINSTLEYLLRLENSFLSIGINLPVGISIFVIAKKV